jgi:hypothetical protein
MEEKTRPLTFDLGDNYNVAKLLLTNSNWLRTLFDKLKLNDNEGIFNKSMFIWRDLPETPTSTVLKYDLTIQVKISKNIDIKKYLKKEVQDLYLLFYSIEKRISKIIFLNLLLMFQVKQWKMNIQILQKKKEK